MSVVTVQTWEDKRGRIGRGGIDVVPLVRTATVSLMDPTPFLAEEELTKKLPIQSIGRKIEEAATMS